VIVNPAEKVSTPTDDWQGVVAYLRYLAQDGPTVRVIGYADSDWGKMPMDSFNKDIQAYADWANIVQDSNANPIDIHLDGIFVDDVPGDDGTNTDSQSIYQNYTSSIRDIMQLDDDSIYIMLNPGGYLPPPYYTMAQQIVTYEQFYSNLNASGSIFDADANAQRACDDDTCPPQQQTFIAHTFNGTDEDLDKLVNDIAVRGEANIFVTNWSTGPDGKGNAYPSFPTIWDRFVTAVSKAETNLQQSSDSKIKRRAINFTA